MKNALEELMEELEKNNISYQKAKTRKDEEIQYLNERIGCEVERV